MTTRGRILVVGGHVGERWDLAWALSEAGIAAEQVGSTDQAIDRIEHGRVAGVVVGDSLGQAVADGLFRRLPPDPGTGEIPFVLVATRATSPEAVVARVQGLLKAAEAPVDQTS